MESTEQNIEGRHRAPLELWIRATFLTLGSIIVTMLGLMFVTFVIGRVMPIDPVLAIVGEQATKATYDAAYEQLGPGSSHNRTIYILCLGRNAWRLWKIFTYRSSSS